MLGVLWSSLSFHSWQSGRGYVEAAVFVLGVDASSRSPVISPCLCIVWRRIFCSRFDLISPAHRRPASLSDSLYCPLQDQPLYGVFITFGMAKVLQYAHLFSKDGCFGTQSTIGQASSTSTTSPRHIMIPFH